MPEPHYILRKHHEDVTCVRFFDAKDNDEIDLLSSGDVSGNVKLWNLFTRRPIHEFRPRKAKCAIPNIEYLPQRSTMMIQTRSSTNGYIFGYDLNKISTENPLFQFDTRCCSFCRFRVVQTLNHSIIPQKVVKNEHKNEEDEEEEIECNQNESLLAKQLKKQNVNGHKNKNKFNDKNENEIVCQNDESSQILVASVGADRGLLQLWNANKMKIIHQMDFDQLPNKEKKRGMIMGIDAFYTKRRNEILIICVSESGYIDVYDVRGSKISFSQKFGENAPLTSMALNKKKTNGICGGTGNILYGFSIKYDLAQIKIKKELKLKNAGLNVIKIRNYDQKVFAFGGWDHRTRIYQYSTFKPLCILKGHKGSITDIDFHSNKNLLATASKDAQIAIYKLY